MNGEYHKPDMVIIDDPALRALDLARVTSDLPEIVRRPDRRARTTPRALGPIDPVDATVPDVNVYLAIHPTGGLAWAGTDRNIVHRYARAIGGVVVRLPAVGDYREKPADGPATVTP